jgi:HD-GYP domain-containing protein (c-di-GMP phosphodiesterase class II)
MDVYKKLVEKSFEFLTLNDYDLILNKILQETKEFLNAEAGTIYIKEKDSLLFQYVMNDVMQVDSSVLRFSNIKLPINNESIAGFVANNKQTLNIEDVYELNGNLPYKFNKDFDKKTGYKTKSVLTIPITDSNNNMLGVMQIINKKDKSDKITSFTETDEKVIAKYFALQAGIALERAILTRATILKMIEMARMRDPTETGEHVKRVANYSAATYRAYLELKGLDDKEHIREIDILKLAAMLHDVGKIGISDIILKKPGKLTDEEFKIIKMHTIYGALLFNPVRTGLDQAARDISLNHHERWDGRGYPGHIDDLEKVTIENICKRPKIGEDIPIFGRIVAVADVFDALVSKRIYKPAWDFDDAVKEINKNAGTQFDPTVVEAFNNSLDFIKKIYKYYQD